MPHSPTSFRFIAYRDFKRTLGKINATAECTELAVRLLIDKARISGNTTAYIQQISRAYDVRVDTIDLEGLPTQVGRFHILSVHEHFESFLRAFRDEHPKAQWVWEKGDDDLRCVLKNIGGGYAASVAEIGKLEIALAEYYRHVRTRVAHELDDKRIPMNVNELRSQVTQSAAYGRLAAPNEFDAIGFDDFILFNRVVKKIALELCRLARPMDGDIAGMLLDLHHRKHHGVDLKTLKSRAGEPDRLRNALGTLLRSVYSLDERESKPIIEEVITGLLA